MKRALTIFLLASPWLVACGGEDETGPEACDPSTVTSLTGNAGAGDGVYGFSCGSADCHGPDGNNGTGAAADLATVIPSRSDDDIACIVKSGKGGMPAQTNLSDQDIADVIAHLRATFP